MATISPPRVLVALLVALVFAVEAAESYRSTSVEAMPLVVSEYSWAPLRGNRLTEHNVRDVAHFAVTMYNRKLRAEDPWKLARLDKGEVLEAGGSLYHLYLTVFNTVHGEKKFQTFVIVVPGARWQSLLFEPLSD